MNSGWLLVPSGQMIARASSSHPSGSFVPLRCPAQQAFFQDAILQGQSGHYRFQLLVLTAQVIHFPSIGFTFGIADQSLLACFQKFFGSFVIHVRVDAFTAADLGDLFFAT